MKKQDDSVIIEDTTENEATQAVVVRGSEYQRAQRNLILGVASAIVLFIIGIILGYLLGVAQQDTRSPYQDGRGTMMQQYSDRTGNNRTMMR
ncbi:MAG TPA: hypothetical protein PKV96_01505 [Candidatus Saccharimonas sp.]|nr:hypothetical protein [Candidatus Saccharimonas sp.]